MIVHMRVCGRLVPTIGVSLALLTSGVAQADITPVPKPQSGAIAPVARGSAKATVSPTPAPSNSAPTPTAAPTAGGQVAAAKPAPTKVAPAKVATKVATTHVTVQAPQTHVTVQAPQTQTVKRPAHLAVRKVTLSTGGRELTAVRALGAHVASSRLVKLFPTPLPFVGGHDSLGAPDGWPDWLLATFAVMASAEAFLLTRLSGAKRFAGPNET
jgi:hypothetical protein